jgi:hypothetical protein
MRTLGGLIFLSWLVGPLAYVLIAQSWCDRRDRYDRLSGIDRG